MCVLGIGIEMKKKNLRIGIEILIGFDYMM